MLLPLLWSGPAHADPLVPGPGQAGHDADLAAKIDRFRKQLHGITSVPLGYGLEAFVSDPSARDQIAGFIASDDETFEAYAGQHVYAVLADYGEYGDLGMFGGVQAAGDALRYAVLRDEGADPAEVDAARVQLLAAMDGLHWYSQVTGVPGVIARGLRRVVPQDGAPPLPGVIPETVPLLDDNGDPLPADKQPTWREDFSGELPHLVWLDDTSKDQFIGHVFALGVVYDVVADDPTIPAEKIEPLVEDARALAQSLMTPRMVGDEMIDLVLVDADGRLTSFHDIAAEILTPGMVSTIPINPFNAAMALGAMRTLYQVTGDEDIGRFYYEGLIEERGYLESAADRLNLIWFGTATNHSNINMAFVSLYGLLRYEPEVEIATAVRTMLETQLYADDPHRSARGLGQSFFDFIVAGFGTQGASGIGEAALADGLSTLVAHPDAPYWDPAVENCDAAEIDAGTCTAIDGSTIVLADGVGWNGGVVAEDPLPMAIRPPSNFLWRSDPHYVNGGGTSRLNPGGDIWCAYWLGRFLQHVDDGTLNISPAARGRPADPDPTTGDTSTGEPPDTTTEPTGTIDPTTGDGSTSTPGTDTDTGTGSSPGSDPAPADGCGCTTSGASPFVLVVLVPLLASRRRRLSRPRRRACPDRRSTRASAPSTPARCDGSGRRCSPRRRSR